MKILIIKFRNIGDVLLSTPLINNLKINYPRSEIDFALNKNCTEMIRLNPNINRIFEYDRSYIKSQNKFLRIFSEIKFINNIVKNNYDLVINLTEGDRGALIALFSRANLKLGFNPRKGILKYLKIYTYSGNDKVKSHTVDKDLQFITLLEKKIFKKNVSIYWSKEDEIKINNLLKQNKVKKFVQVHPVSRWMFKCWEDERMAKIIDFLEIEKNLKVIITASNESKEIERVNKIISNCKIKPLNLSGQLSLKELTYLSSKSTFYFGVDTAPMHIAAAVGAPVISLMGASEPLFWGPWDNDVLNCTYRNITGVQKNGKNVIFSNINHEILYEEGVKKCKGMIAISFESVLDLINKKINC